MRSPTVEMTLARCRRVAEALDTASTDQKLGLARELADLLSLLEAHAGKEPSARTWLRGEATRVRDSVLTAEVRRRAPAWAGPLLLPRDIVEAMDGEEYEG